MESSRHLDDLIPSYVLGALAADEAELVRAHCAGCTACTRTLEVATEVAAASAAQRGRRPPAGRAAGQSTRHTAPWQRVLLFSLPWTVAVLGWIVAASFIAYSHGQTDRLRVTRQSLTATITSLQFQVTQASAVINYISTPQIQVTAFQSPHLTRWGASVSLLYSAHYATALLVARGLPVLPADRAYTIWARGDGGPYIRLGTLTIKGARHDGVAIVVGSRSFEHVSSVVLSIERNPATRQPGAAIVGMVTIVPTMTR